MKTFPTIKNIALLMFILATSSWADLPSKAETLERVVQTLVMPPGVPEHTQIASGPPKIVQIRMTVIEKEIEIGGGAYVQAMTFNGSVPGPLIVVHQNDYLEITLVNPESNTFLHNIDFHAATGAMGAGELTQVSPGQEVTVRFKATKAGIFVYHCAPGGLMIPYHVVSGMNGAIMVLPREGLKDELGNTIEYDRAFYIGEQDFYIPHSNSGIFKRYNSTAEAMGETLNVMRTLTPSHIVFNGRVGSLTGSGALSAITGEKVLFIHSQANRDTRPHLIGGHGDLVWYGGSFTDKPMTTQETWFVPAGTAVAALYQFKQPGLYAYVNHNLIESLLLGAVAHINVEGVWDNDLMEQIRAPGPIKE